MFSVAYVDNDHLLLTFNTRTLMRRGADEPADDDDRSVSALLLELPTGKVLARTVWHMHDHGRYLWPLGDGPLPAAHPHHPDRSLTLSRTSPAAVMSSMRTPSGT